MWTRAPDPRVGTPPFCFCGSISSGSVLWRAVRRRVGRVRLAARAIGVVEV
jgi:hypothetical protein